MGLTVTGTKQLQNRLRLLAQSGRPIVDGWATETSAAARTMVPVRTGALRRSIHPGDASSDGGSVLANKSAIYVDRGTHSHTIIPERASTLAFKDNGRTVFSKRVAHPGGRPKPFTHRAAVAGMTRTSMRDIAIAQWNKGA